MSRKSRVTERRNIAPDPKYRSIKVSKFINLIMERGKKSVAQKVMYDALEKVAERTKKEAIDVFEVALKNVSPSVEVKARRVGGANYQIPIEVMEPRKTALAMRWLIEAASKHAGLPMARRLAEEFVLASEKQGAAMKKKEDVFRMAEANRAFAHFARFTKRK